MFGKNEMKVCYAKPGLEGGEGRFTKYEGEATTFSTVVLLPLLPVEGTLRYSCPCGPTNVVGATRLGFIPA